MIYRLFYTDSILSFHSSDTLTIPQNYCCHQIIFPVFGLVSSLVVVIKESECVAWFSTFLEICRISELLNQAKSIASDTSRLVD